MDNLKETLKSADISFIENQPMWAKTTFKIGSTANLFIAPDNISQFLTVLNIVNDCNFPFFILGGGSNTVFPDSVFKPVVISTENLKSISILPSSSNFQADEEGDVLICCQAGTTMASLVNFCTANCLSGLEQFAGLPGSVGGAVFMNARCFNKSISDVFYSADYVEFSNTSVASVASVSNVSTSSAIISGSLSYDPAQWEYKKSPFQPAEGSSGKGLHKYVLSATFKLHKVPEEKKVLIESECKKYISERVSKGHFKYPSAGSVFKNNRSFGKPSGLIIDEAGLRGFTIGGAQIAPFHGNFIININNAKSTDVQNLVKHVQNTVKEKFGFYLEPEIIFL